MKLGKISVLILCLAIGLLSCKKDDDGGTEIEVTPPRDIDEVKAEDILEIETYLESHYYNSSEFEAIENPKSADIDITKLLEGQVEAPIGFTILEDSPFLETIPVVFDDTNYEIYVLNLNQGGGTESPSFADNVLVDYQGFTSDNVVFDSTVTPVELDLSFLIQGWRNVLPSFNTTPFDAIIGEDGTITYRNHGMGVMFIPSGLAYFDGRGPSGDIEAYSPLIFKFSLFKTRENDHDNDGIPSYLEDLDGNKAFTLADPEDETITHDDTDEDRNANFLDPDDDGDGVPTINEDIDGDGDPTNDIGKNGIAKYLDPEETESN